MNSRCRFTEVVIYRPNDGFLCEENGTTAPCSYRVLSYSLAVCAATLEQAGIRIQVLDAGAERLSTVDALRRIASIRPKILIISVNNFAAGLALKGVEALKKSLNLHVLALLTHDLEEECLLSYPFIDAGIRREWCAASADAVRAILDSKPLSEVPGVVMLEDGKAIRTGERPHQPLDERPYPALHLFPMRLYDAYQIYMSEGCNHHCSFCWFCHYPKSGWSGRHPERVVEELAMLKGYGNRLVFTTDDELTMDPENTKSLCSAMIDAKLNMMISGNTRASSADEELFSLMSRAGFFSLNFGAESGLQWILNKNGTQKSLQDIKRAYRMLRKQNIICKVFFLIGMLHETPETIHETFRFITEELQAYDASFDIAIPYPKTIMFKELKKKGWIKTLNTENLTWIYYHIYGATQLEQTPMEKPSWRIGDLRFDDLIEIEREYKRLIPHGRLGTKIKRLTLNTDFRKTLASLFCRSPLQLGRLVTASMAGR